MKKTPAKSATKTISRSEYDALDRLFSMLVRATKDRDVMEATLRMALEDEDFLVSDELYVGGDDYPDFDRLLENLDITVEENEDDD